MPSPNTFNISQDLQVFGNAVVTGNTNILGTLTLAGSIDAPSGAQMTAPITFAGVSASSETNYLVIDGLGNLSYNTSGGGGGGTFTGGTVTGPTNFTNGLTANTVAISGSTLTGGGATSALDISQTWNTSGTPIALKVNVTDTASATLSDLISLQVGGSVRFRVVKSGFFTFNTGGEVSGNLVVGGASIDSSSILEARSTTKGFLPPRMTSTQRDAITSPTTGLITYQTTDNYLSLYNGVNWQNIVSPNSSGNIILNSTTGNTLIGTTANTGTYKLDVRGATRLSATTGTSLTVISSGNSTSSPVFSVQGSQGELFSVTDSLTGSLFSVSDISGLPIMEVFSDSTTIIGDYQAPSLYTTKRVSSITATTGTTIYSFPTSAYTSSFVDYNVSGSTGLRAGNIMAIWSGSSVNFTETSTNDIGNTTPLTFGFVMSGSSAVLQASASTGTWIVKSIVRGL